jgi:hypothetical protein
MPVLLEGPEAVMDAVEKFGGIFQLYTVFTGTVPL